MTVSERLINSGAESHTHTDTEASFLTVDKMFHCLHFSSVTFSPAQAGCSLRVYLSLRLAELVLCNIIIVNSQNGPNTSCFDEIHSGNFTASCCMQQPFIH